MRTWLKLVVKTWVVFKILFCAIIFFSLVRNRKGEIFIGFKKANVAGYLCTKWDHGCVYIILVRVC